MINLVKRKSKIHGNGIFTNQGIKKNITFYIVPGDKIFKKPAPKCAFIGNKTWISDKKVLNYVNHSCNPNTKLEIKTKIPKLISLRNISKNEEITVNYSKTEKGKTKIPCKCKEDNCKGYFLIRK